MKQITIIGSGFAGLKAIAQLRKIDAQVQITLISPRAELHYLPSIIWIPSLIRRREDLMIPLARFLARHHVKLIQANVMGLSDDGRLVHTDMGDVRNDGLIIASGGRFIKKLTGIEHAITPCEGIDAAEKIRDRLHELQGGTIAVGFASNPNEPAAMRGGPMFEFLFGIDTWLRQQGRREQFKLVFFSPAAQPGNRLGPNAVKGLLMQMQKRGIETHLGHKILRFESNQVVTEGGQFDADLILFMPGMTGNAWFDHSTLPRSSGGLVSADAHCKVAGFEHVYIAGDSGSFPGPDWMPKQAHIADLQAVAAAKNLIASLNGQPADALFKIELVCIIDALNTGTFIMRTEKRAIVLPSMRLFHWLKRGFEWWYLKQYR